MTIFPFLISYTKVCNYLLEITNQAPVSTDICVVSWILLNFINIWFIVTITKIIIRVFKKIIRVIG